MPTNPDELGALWEKSSAKGPYLTGTINGQPVVCFRNRSDNPKAPAWRVMKSKPKPEGAVDQRRDDGDDF